MVNIVKYRQTQQEVFNVFNDIKSELYAIGRKRMSSSHSEDGNTTFKSALMVDEVTAETIVDDLLISVSTCRRAKKGFNDRKHIERYFFKSLHKNIKTHYKILYTEMIPPITKEEMAEQFKLAIRIIDSNRSQYLKSASLAR